MKPCRKSQIDVVKIHQSRVSQPPARNSWKNYTNSGKNWLSKWEVSEINIGKPDELPERQKALRQISVSECEFSKAVDQAYFIRTGTALGDIHVAGRLSRTSCSLHPDYSPLLKKISTLSDRHLPEGLLPLREFCLSSPLNSSFWKLFQETSSPRWG